jgi:arsenate reductase-like glutaredoxin family protein
MNEVIELMKMHSKTSLSINDIRHSRSRFGSNYLALNYLDNRRRRYISELTKKNMCRETLYRHLSKVEAEIEEIVNLFKK